MHYVNLLSYLLTYLLINCYVSVNSTALNCFFFSFSELFSILLLFGKDEGLEALTN